MPLFDILPLLPECPSIKIVDIGAMSLGVGTDPYQQLLETGLATVIGFEPNRIECEKLQEMAVEGRVYLPYAIGDGTRRTLHICNSSPTSSLLEPNLSLADRFQNLGSLMQVVSKEEVQTHRLDDLVEVQGADFLKVDVQGGELDVFSGAHRLLAETLVIQTEVEFVPLYKQQPLFSDIDLELRKHGFLIHKFVGIMGRAFKPIIMNGDINRMVSQMLWSDAVYLKNFMNFDNLNPQQLLKIAIILHVQYQSVDLALVALCRYDAKKGTSVAIQYNEKLTGGKASVEVAHVLEEMSRPLHQS